MSLVVPEMFYYLRGPFNVDISARIWIALKDENKAEAFRLIGKMALDFIEISR
jgi:hypothetical protein